MPLPLILGIGAAIAGVAGVGSGISGASKIKDAKETMEEVKSEHQANLNRFQRKSDETNRVMDDLGTLELTILNSFETFSDTIEKIQNRPQFKEYAVNGVKLPAYDREALKEVSVGAGAALGALAGAAVGTTGSMVAAWGACSAVVALGTASTGTAIGTLSGAAATNATLAALGGGSLAAGGGGVALGTTMLGAATLGVGLLVGGVIFNFTGDKLEDQADEAYDQMKSAEKKINKACCYLKELEDSANEYSETLEKVRKQYNHCFRTVSSAVNKMHKTDWNEFSEREKLATENSVLLVGLLYKMCQVQLVLKAEDENELDTVNKEEMYENMENAEQVLCDVAVTMA